MTDLKLDKQGDLEITNGKMNLISSVPELNRQTLQTKMRTYLSEWFLDVDIGIPYFQKILKKGTSTNVVDAIFKDAILSHRDVQGITSFKSSIGIDRSYSVQFSASIAGGESITINELIKF